LATAVNLALLVKLCTRQHGEHGKRDRVLHQGHGLSLARLWPLAVLARDSHRVAMRKDLIQPPRQIRMDLDMCRALEVHAHLERATVPDVPFAYILATVAQRVLCG